MQLLPCPFCGTSERDDEQERGLPAWLQLSEHTDAWSVECYECGTETRWVDTAADAVASWNRRVVWPGASFLSSASDPPELVGGGDWALAECIVRLLNALLALDREAVSALVAARVPCNAAIAAHPSVQIGANPATPDGGLLGVLGLLNGICGALLDGPRVGWGPIAAQIRSFTIDEGQRKARDVLVERFVLMNPPQEPADGD